MGKADNIIAVCISRKLEQWQVPEIPFFCYTEGYKQYQSFPPLKTVERIKYLADRRNKANENALKLNRDAKYFFSVDSYYLTRTHEIRWLIEEYKLRSEDIVLGGAPWFNDTSVWPSKRKFWDTWATPELAIVPVGQTGWLRVRGCGGFTIYPRWLWEERGFGVPYPFPESGNEVNYLCANSKVPSFVSLNVKPKRETPKELLAKPFGHRLRTRLALGTRFG